MKNVLILISKGPQYRPLFCSIGDYMKKRNINVIYSLESHYTDYEYNNGKPIIDSKAYYFSDYLKKSNEINAEDIIESYKYFNMYETLVSDYDRQVTHSGLWKQEDRNQHISKLIKLISFFEIIIKEHNIDTIIHECAANEFAHVAYLVSKKHSIKYIGLQSARIPGRLEIHDGPNGPLFRKKIEDVNISDEMQTFVNNFVKGIKDITPFYMKSKFNSANVNYIKEYISLTKVLKIINLIKYRFKFRETINDEFGAEKPLALSFVLFKREFRKFLKVKNIQKFYDMLIPEVEFYIYPIHYEPEASVSVWAKFYIDQINFIRTVAFQLPFGSYLYVKDHKSSKGLLSDRFYREIKLIPNVRFISPDINSKELAMRSQGIITLTSTLGFEALAMRKRVYVFGDVFFEKHPYAVKIPHFRNLFEQLCKDQIEPPIYKSEYDKFFLEYFINTYQGHFDVYNQDNQLFEDIYFAIENYVKH